MAKRMKPLPVGTVFANGWRILEHWNCAQSVEHGLGGKNSHYLCVNESCGTTYAFENSNVRRWMDNQIGILQKCRNCKGDKCYYSSQNFKTIRKSINREPEKIIKGQVYGELTVISDEYPSKLFADHQCHVICRCSRCKGEHFMRYDDLREGRLPCCGKGRSLLYVQKTLSEESVSPQSASV